ncbi:MAG TPA: hypothetical protein VJ253_05020 [Dehalococcoidia bacterium]|nr:hypothetical protein [Dehalococcoidia bacterium]
MEPACQTRPHRLPLRLRAVRARCSRLGPEWKIIDADIIARE